MATLLTKIRRCCKAWGMDGFEDRYSAAEKANNKYRMEVFRLRNALGEAIFAHYLSSARKLPNGSWELYWLEETKNWAKLAGIDLTEKDPADYYLPPSR